MAMPWFRFSTAKPIRLIPNSDYLARKQAPCPRDLILGGDPLLASDPAPSGQAIISDGNHVIARRH